MFESAPIEFDCPKCGHKIQKTIGWLTSRRNMLCPNCFVTIKLDTDKLAGGIKEIEKAIDGIPKSINIKL